MYCPKCGAQAVDDARFCIHCGCMIADYLPGAASSQEYAVGPLGGVIPYKNMNALLAYYFGVFSIIPGLGVLLAIPAVALGVMGLRYFKQSPQTKGRAHAWVGIVCGLLFGFGQVAFIVAVSL